MVTPLPRAAFALSLVLAVTACATRPGSAPSAAIGARGESAAGATTATSRAAPAWARTELYFGLRREGEPGGEADRGPWSEARWQRFLDEVVTPEFPAGFTVLDAYGQWRREDDGRIYRLVSKVVMLVHEATPANDARLERVRARFLETTGQEGVIRSTQPATVSFR